MKVLVSAFKQEKSLCDCETSNFAKFRWQLYLTLDTATAGHNWCAAAVISHLT